MCLTKEPLMIKRIIREIIHISTKTFLEESQCDIQIGQVHSPLYIFNMPYCMENMKYSIGTRQTGMKFMKGVLASLGPRQEYMYYLKIYYLSTVLQY